MGNTRFNRYIELLKKSIHGLHLTQAETRELIELRKMWANEWYRTIK